MKNFGSVLFVLFVLAVLGCKLAAASPITAAPRSSAFVLSNRSLRIRVDQKCGGLVEFTDSKGQHNFAALTEPSSLWELDVIANGHTQTLSSARAQSFQCEKVPGGGSALRLIWTDFDLAPAPRLRVQVDVRLARALPISHWRIGVDGLGEITLRQSRFPRVAGIPKQEHEILAVPAWLGQRTDAPRRLLAGSDGQGRRFEWFYPGQMSLQCLAFYSSNGSGLYVACNDTAALRKAFAFFGDSREKIGFELTHLPEQGILEKPGGSGRADRPASWSLPYEVILGTFQGDWITAAETYRSWATNQAWARESRLRRGEVPSWILNTGMWVWNRGRSENVLPPAVSLSQELHLPVNVCWHWWHGCAYDTGFPEYLPPREGVEPFKAALSAAQAKGVHALAYMNQRLWGMNTKSWHDEGAARFAVKGPDREIHPEIYNSFTKAPCASMCLGTQFWRRKYSSLAEQAVRDLGLDGIYMDQACASLSCYDPTHGHPLSGGSYWMDGFRSLAGEIRAAVPAVALAGEGCGEPWLPYLDLMLCLQVSKERYSAPDGSLFPSSLPSITNVR